MCCCRMEIITPKEFVGALMELSQARRGDFVDMQFLTEARTTLIYNLPLAEASPPARACLGFYADASPLLTSCINAHKSFWSCILRVINVAESSSEHVQMYGRLAT